MSVVEEKSLAELLIQSMPTDVLANIKAQIRAATFLSLSEDEVNEQSQSVLNEKLKSGLDTNEGKLMFNLVREFLEFYNLQFSANVYEKETQEGSLYQYKSRNELIEELGIVDVKDNIPLLLQCNPLDLSKMTLNNISSATDL